MGAVEAVVDVLTAEVRTLMVGNRQVTMSVFKQLDVVECEECEPFGRVSYIARNDGWGRIWAVGRHHLTGVLVRSYNDPGMSPNAWSEPGPSELKDWCVVGPYGYGGRPSSALIASDGAYHERWKIPHDAPIDETVSPGRWRFSSPGKEDEALKLAADSFRSVRRFKQERAEWEALPLIVLAGLR